LSIVKKVSRTIENVLDWVLGGIFIVCSLVFLLAHDTWQKVKTAWETLDAESSFPLSGAMGGTAIGGALGGIPGSIVGFFVGLMIGVVASSGKKKAPVAISVPPPSPLGYYVDEDVNIPVHFEDIELESDEVVVRKSLPPPIPKTKSKKKKVKKQSKNSKTSDTIVPPAPKKKPGRPRKSSKKAE